MSRRNDQKGATPLSQLRTERADEFNGWHWDPARRQEVTQVAEGQQAPVSEKSCIGSSNGTLDERERRFLKAVVDNPGQPSSAIAKLAGLGTHQAIAVRKQLIELGYLREHSVNTGQRGRAAKILEPLPKAMALLEG